MLTGADTVGVAPTAPVPLGLGADDPRRGDVEEWLAEKEREGARQVADRHRQLLFWARTASVAVIVMPLLVSISGLCRGCC